ncbi:unnamed protein product [Heligmosomoides polygyrus]|uniref:Secreted protein n=1 Tax=Heligmosomoides polygyrus TaxID=6339 RepID=A0A183FS92_HELPZ|nr:unnamed protein product [Heligmosomoides polygyrus]
MYKSYLTMVSILLPIIQANEFCSLFDMENTKLYFGQTAVVPSCIVDGELDKLLFRYSHAVPLNVLCVVEEPLSNFLGVGTLPECFPRGEVLYLPGNHAALLISQVSHTSFS